jgi:hypothetical protein
MLRQIISASALMLATVPAIALSAFAAPAPRVTVFNQGGYVADYQISYVADGQANRAIFELFNHSPSFCTSPTISRTTFSASFKVMYTLVL